MSDLAFSTDGGTLGALHDPGKTEQPGRVVLWDVSSGEELADHDGP